MKELIFGFLEGCGAGALSGITAITYYDQIKDEYPKWISVPVSCFVLAGTSIIGWKGLKTLDHYFESNVL